MKALHLLLVATCVLVASVPAHAGKMSKSKQPLAADPNMATIVFMRPGELLGRAIEVPVYDVTGDKTDFLGFVEAGARKENGVRDRFSYQGAPKKESECTFTLTLAPACSGARSSLARRAADVGLRSSP